MISRLAQTLKVHRTAVFYAGSSQAFQAAQLICQFMVLRFIAPQWIGVWAAAALVQTYLAVTQLGIVNAMNREYPYFLGKGDRDSALGIVRTAQAWCLGNGVLLAGLFSALSLVYGGKGWEWRITFLTFAASAPLQQYNAYLEGTYRAGSEFRSLAWQQLVRVPITFLLLLLPWRLGYDGFCAQNFLQAASSAVLCHWFRPVRAGPGLRKDSLRLLLSTGWRLYLTSYLLQVSQSFPRLALATLGGALLLAPDAAKEGQALLLLGLFTPVSWMVTAMNGVAGSVSSYLYPTLTYRYAKDNLPVGRVALRSAVKVTLGLVPCAAAGMAAMPLLLRLLRPEYLRGLWAVEVAILAGLLDCLTVAGVTFAATKAWRPYYVFVACALAARAAGAYVGYHSLEDRLLGVALGMLAASAAMGLVTWRTVRRAGLPAAP